ncbi:endolytic transglycosylase MltG [Paenibacillus solani]|uniref:endolytic transglycosylase MltG n=1 Tax=Paenibacillus solani TaxID=1705565 RepID=UPI003D2732F0
MIKNRTFMMGVGTGLVIGAVLLQLMWVGQGTTASVTQSLTKEELTAAAEALDLQVVEGSDELLTEEQWEEKKLADNDGSESADKDSSLKPNSEKPAIPQQPKQPGADADKQESPQVNKPVEPKTPAKVKASIQVRIPAGNNLSDVANSLLTAGVIEDKQAFINKATEKKINRTIQSGTYSFTAGESYNSIIAKITAKPSS